MKLDSFITLEAFLSAHLAALEQDQPRYNLMLGILNRAKADPEGVRLWSFGEGVACAVQTPPHYVVLGELNQQQGELLARELVDKDFIGCLGPAQSAESFAGSLFKLGVPLELEMPQRIYTLDTPPKYPGCDGSGRRGNPKDINLFVDWFSCFCSEAVPNDPPQDRKRMEQQFAEKQIFFWEIDGTPVSMAARTRDTKDGSNISLVYTPHEFRGKGYGGSATAFACEDVFNDGKKTCFLYTDLRNPTSNRVYQKIGFTPWCDSQTFSRAKNFIQLRPTTAEDFEFVKSLHHETLREYVEPIWGWDEAKQDMLIKNWFKPERIQIIKHENSDVGLLVVVDREVDLYLDNISIIPSRQGMGIGAVVIRNVMNQASNENRPLRLQVLKTNPKARKLYERLGFILEKETQNHFVLIFLRKDGRQPQHHEN